MYGVIKIMSETASLSPQYFCHRRLYALVNVILLESPIIQSSSIVSSGYGSVLSKNIWACLMPNNQTIISWVQTSAEFRSPIPVGATTDVEVARTFGA